MDDFVEALDFLNSPELVCKVSDKGKGEFWNVYIMQLYMYMYMYIVQL